MFHVERTWIAADYPKPQELDGSIILQRLVIGRNVTLLEEASVFGGTQAGASSRVGWLLSKQQLWNFERF